MLERIAIAAIGAAIGAVYGYIVGTKIKEESEALEKENKFLKTELKKKESSSSEKS